MGAGRADAELCRGLPEAAGGKKPSCRLYEGANHGFMTGKPDAPYAAPAIERIKQFIRKHTTG